MDETPEELEEIRREAATIDPYRYRRRLRALAGVAIGGLAAGLVALVLKMHDDARNPCERVRDHLCRKAPGSLECTTYAGITDESVHDDSPTMRGQIRSQCEKKLNRLTEEGERVR